MDTATVTVMAAMASTASNKPLLLLLCLFSTAVWAGDWKFTPSLAVSERYSDNVNLGTTGREETDWITEISPRIALHRSGARIKANVDYSLQGLLYANDSDRNSVRHHLNGQSNAELIDNWLFLDTGARISQELVNQTSNGGLGDGVGSGNSTSVASYTLSPYVKHRIGSIANLDARIAHDGVFIGNAGFSDTNSTRYSLAANSGTYFLPFSWSASYSKTDTSNSGALADSGSERAAANARYQLNKKFGLLAQASMEKNDFTGINATLRDYSSYGLGAFYVPSRRLSMDVYYNKSDTGNFVSGSATLNPTLRTSINAVSTKRAFGRSHSLNLAHRTRKSNWSLSYLDDLTTSQQQFSFRALTQFYICPSDRAGIDTPEMVILPNQPSSPLCIPVGGPISGTLTTPLINQTFISKTLTGTVSYSLRRNTWMLSLYDTQREFQGLARGDDTTRGIQASWLLRPAAHTTFSLSGGLSQQESTTRNRQDDLWNLSLSATHQFQSKVSGSLEVRRQERESNLLNNDFTENSVAARLNMSF
jgi:uncharacterized protein (PEP-CTERM system associated)